jgi:hypothetical protein
MSQYQMMTFRIDLPEGSTGMGEVVTLPNMWEPISALRLGETVLVLCRQQTGAPPPSGGSAPVLTSLSPNTLPAGSDPATVDVYGSNFDSSCQIESNGTARATFYFDSGHLEYTARPDLATQGQVSQMTVVGTNGTSNALPLTFT